MNILCDKNIYGHHIWDIYQFVHDKKSFLKKLLFKIKDSSKKPNVSDIFKFISEIIKNYGFKPDKSTLYSLVDSLQSTNMSYCCFHIEILLNNIDKLGINDAKHILKLQDINMEEVITYFTDKITFDDELISYICSNIQGTYKGLIKLITSNKITLNVKHCILIIKKYNQLANKSSILTTIKDTVVAILLHYLNSNGIINNELFKECSKVDMFTQTLLANGYIPTNEDLQLCTENGCNGKTLTLITQKIPNYSSHNNSIITHAIENKNADAIYFAIENGTIPTENEYYEIFGLIKKIDTVQKLMNIFNLDIRCLENACTVNNNNSVIEYIINSGIEPNEICIHNLCNSSKNDNIIGKLIHRKYKFTLINLKDVNEHYRGKKLINDMIRIIEY